MNQFDEYAPWIDRPIEAKTKKESFPFQNELEAHSPFQDPYNEVGVKHFGLDEYETPLENQVEVLENSYLVNDGIVNAGIENELTGSELIKAVNLNRTYMIEYGWQKYAKDILKVLGIADDHWITNSAEKNLEFFTNYFANWQDRNGIKTTQKGVFGLNNWTYFQKKLGLHNLGNQHAINVEKAVQGNRATAKKWLSSKRDIYEHLQAKGIVTTTLPLNEEYFAYAIAAFQAKVGGLKIDGIIGDHTLASLISGGVSINPSSAGPVSAGTGLAGDLDFKYRELRAGNVQQIATNYMDVLNNLRHLFPIEIEQLKKELKASPQNQAWISPAFSVIATIVAVAAIPLTGGASMTLVGLSGGLGMAGTMIQDYDNKQAQKVADAKNNANELVLSAIKSTSDLSITQYEIVKFIKDVIDKKKLGEFIALMRKLEEITRSSQLVRKYALHSIIKFYKATCQLIVHYKNDKSIDLWTEKDVENVGGYAELKVEFFQDNPSDFFFSGLTRFGGDSGRILKSAWGLWSKEFLLKDATAFHQYFIVFRTYFKEYEAPGFWDLAGKIKNVPYDVFIMGSEQSALSQLFFRGYPGISSIYRPDVEKIVFISPTTKKRKEIHANAANSKGLRYGDQLILPLVNLVMERDFNAGPTARRANYVESELDLSSEIETDAIRNGEEEVFYEYENNRSVIASTFFSPEKNKKATQYNQSQVQKSGLSLTDILAVLSKTIDIPGIRQSLVSFNQSNPSATYRIDHSGTPAVDSVFTVAIHQFQMANYLNPADHDGIVGQSTIETLGFVNHGLKSRLNSSGYYGQGQLNRGEVKSQVPVLTNNEFSAANWYQFIVKPAWLGVKISDGIHLILLRKLKEAQQWLLSQPSYKGMTPAALGRALGFNAETRYSGARLSASKQAMHGFGLALDIHVFGNPWIGAGWVQYDKVLLQERYRMINALRAASGNQSLAGDTIFAYLNNIAQSAGQDTRVAYHTLKQRNDEFIRYLNNNAAELSYWKKSQSFGNRDPLNGFLNLHADLVYALRQIAGLAWGAIDFGPRASGDIMHFDVRTLGVGKFLCEKIGGYVPKSGHPILQQETIPDETAYEEWMVDNLAEEDEFHEAIEENIYSETD